jgi:hypothetical protein
MASRACEWWWAVGLRYATQLVRLTFDLSLLNVMSFNFEHSNQLTDMTLAGRWRILL